MRRLGSPLLNLAVPAVVSLAAVAGTQLVTLAPASAATATSLAQVQAQLKGCTGTTASPTTITLGSDIGSDGTPGGTIGVPCVVSLDLAGHTFALHHVLVDAGHALTVRDSSNTASAPAQGKLIVGSDDNPDGPGFTLTDASVVIDASVETEYPTVGFSASGGQISVLEGGDLVAYHGIDLGQGGSFSMAAGGYAFSSGDDDGPAVGGSGLDKVTLTGYLGAYSLSDNTTDGPINGVVLGDHSSLSLSGGLGHLTAPGAVSLGADSSVSVRNGAGLDAEPDITGAAGIVVGASSHISVAAAGITAHGDGDAPGISLPPSATLGMSGGKIDAVGAGRGAGIGGAAGQNGGQVSVSNGTIVASGDTGAGIGGGRGGAGGALVMTGGSVTATSGSGSALGGGAATGGGSIGHIGRVSVGGGILHLPSGGLTVTDENRSGAEVQIGLHGTLDGGPDSSGHETYARIHGPGQIKNRGTIRLPNSQVTGGGTTVLQHHYRVHFDTRGGKPRTIAAVTVLAGSFTAGRRVFPAAPTRSGYTFRGWFTTPSGKGVRLRATSTLPGHSKHGEPAKVTAYARWHQH